MKKSPSECGNPESANLPPEYEMQKDGVGAYCPFWGRNWREQEDKYGRTNAQRCTTSNFLDTGVKYDGFEGATGRVVEDQDRHANNTNCRFFTPNNDPLHINWINRENCTSAAH
jgi:hypothetical protein